MQSDSAYAGGHALEGGTVMVSRYRVIGGVVWGGAKLSARHLARWYYDNCVRTAYRYGY